MSTAECYASLGRMLDYPWEKEGLLAAFKVVSGQLPQHEAECAMAPFAAFVETSTAAQIQEEYVATFDFSPKVAPYLGHHLFGDNQKKGEYLIRLKGEYGRYGYAPPGNELPDYLPLVLGFLAHRARLESGISQGAFIAGSVLPGVEKLAASFEASRPDSPWRPVVEAARLICSADSQDGSELRSSAG